MTDETETLAGLRDDIDRLDDSIAGAVAERIRTAEAVAETKAEAGADLVDEDREEVVKSHYEERFRQEGLDGETGRALAEFLIECSLERERAIDDRV